MIERRTWTWAPLSEISLKFLICMDRRIILSDETHLRTKLTSLLSAEERRLVLWIQRVEPELVKWEECSTRSQKRNRQARNERIFLLIWKPPGVPGVVSLLRAWSQVWRTWLRAVFRKTRVLSFWTHPDLDEVRILTDPRRNPLEVRFQTWLQLRESYLARNPNLNLSHRVNSSSTNETISSSQLLSLREEAWASRMANLPPWIAPHLSEKWSLNPR